MGNFPVSVFKEASADSPFVGTTRPSTNENDVPINSKENSPSSKGLFDCLDYARTTRMV